MLLDKWKNPTGRNQQSIRKHIQRLLPIQQPLSTPSIRTTRASPPKVYHCLPPEMNYIS